jgi:hypothetical protein
MKDKTRKDQKMLIDISISGKNYLRYEADQVPAIGETITIFGEKNKNLVVVSVDYLLEFGFGGKPRLSVVTVNTKKA